MYFTCIFQSCSVCVYIYIYTYIHGCHYSVCMLFGMCVRVCVCVCVCVCIHACIHLYAAVENRCTGLCTCIHAHTTYALLGFWIDGCACILTCRYIHTHAYVLLHTCIVGDIFTDDPRVRDISADACMHSYIPSCALFISYMVAHCYIRMHTHLYVGRTLFSSQRIVMHISTHTHMNMHIQTHAHTFILRFAHFSAVSAWLICTHIHIHIYTYTHTYIHVYLGCTLFCCQWTGVPWSICIVCMGKRRYIRRRAYHGIGWLNYVRGRAYHGISWAKLNVCVSVSVSVCVHPCCDTSCVFIIME